MSESENLCNLLIGSKKLYRYRRNIIFSMNSDDTVIGIVTDDDNDITSYTDENILIETRTIPEILRGHTQKLISMIDLTPAEKLKILISLDKRHTDYGDTIIHDDDRIIIHAPHKKTL